MATINISLTPEQADWIDRSTSSLGFANRSEFVRSLIRFISQREDLIKEAQTFPFVPPATTNKQQIIQDFHNSGKYSPEFIEDLAQGLSRSDYFK